MAEVRLAIDFAHPCERVWRAFTDARVLSDWFMPTDLEAREGSRFTLEPGTLPGFLGPVTGELLEVLPQQRLVMLWQGEKLHTRVVWEITATEDGCRLELVQSGFIGAPAALRGRALRATYHELFAERLPATLDALAAAGFGGVFKPSQPRPDEAGRPASGGSPGPGGLRAAVPSQRRPNAAAAWSAGRVLGSGQSLPAQVAGGAGQAAGGAGQAAGGAGQAAVAVEPRTALPAPRAPQAAERVVGPDASPPVESTFGRTVARLRRLRHRLPAGRFRRWLGVVPPWLRGTVAGTGCVVLALVLVAALGPGGFGRSGFAPGGGEERRPPGVAMQPGQGQAEPHGTAPAGSSDGGAGAPSGVPGPRQRPGEHGTSVQQVPGPEVGGPPSALDPTGGQVSPTEPGASNSPVPEETAAPPVLTASMATSGIPLLGGRAVEITVANPGPGGAETWELVTDVGDQNVINVTGAAYERDGALAIFTPLAGLAEGTATVVRFEIQAPVLGLLGASDPTSCTIDGRACD